MRRICVGLLIIIAACSEGSPLSAPVPPPIPVPIVLPLRVMPLGDSITQANTERNSYRRPLFHALQAENANVDFVGSVRQNHLGPPPNPDFDLDHEGHWGWTADEILAEVGGWAQTHRPDIVLLHLGSNDMLRGQGIGSTLQELSGILAALRSAHPRVVVLLAQLIPADTPQASRIVELNAALPGLAASLTSHESPVAIVDQFTGFDAVADTVDGVHPNDRGEEKMAQRWLDALRPLVIARDTHHSTGSGARWPLLDSSGTFVEELGEQEAP
jgi:lysophospholipase L1-like esterase